MPPSSVPQAAAAVASPPPPSRAKAAGERDGAKLASPGGGTLDSWLTTTPSRAPQSAASPPEAPGARARQAAAQCMRSAIRSSRAAQEQSTPARGTVAVETAARTPASHEVPLGPAATHLVPLPRASEVRAGAACLTAVVWCARSRPSQRVLRGGCCSRGPVARAGGSSRWGGTRCKDWAGQARTSVRPSRPKRRRQPCSAIVTEAAERHGAHPSFGANCATRSAAGKPGPSAIDQRGRIGAGSTCTARHHAKQHSCSKRGGRKHAQRSTTGSTRRRTARRHTSIKTAAPHGGRAHPRSRPDASPPRR